MPIYGHGRGFDLQNIMLRIQSNFLVIILPKRYLIVTQSFVDKLIKNIDARVCPNMVMGVVFTPKTSFYAAESVLKGFLRSRYLNQAILIENGYSGTAKTGFYGKFSHGQMGVALLGVPNDEKFCSDRKTLVHTHIKVCEKYQECLTICR